MAKQATKILARDVAISSRFKFDLKSWQNKNNNECFYYNKKRYYAKDCNLRKNEKRNINSQEAR